MALYSESTKQLLPSLTPYATSWDIVIHDFLALHRKMVQNIQHSTLFFTMLQFERST